MYLCIHPTFHPSTHPSIIYPVVLIGITSSGTSEALSLCPFPYKVILGPGFKHVSLWTDPWTQASQDLRELTAEWPRCCVVLRGLTLEVRSDGIQSVRLGQTPRSHLSAVTSLFSP